MAMGCGDSGAEWPTLDYINTDHSSAGQHVRWPGLHTKSGIFNGTFEWPHKTDRC
jgi:hypothetical protein